jgi:hypothetical protein
VSVGEDDLVAPLALRAVERGIGGPEERTARVPVLRERGHAHRAAHTLEGVPAVGHAKATDGVLDLLGPPLGVRGQAAGDLSVSSRPSRAASCRWVT